MKIYTKTGDKGETSLYGGKRVMKSSLRIHTYGTVDELNSYIGLLAAFPVIQEFHQELTHVQNILFNIGAILAADTASGKKLHLPEISDNDITALENSIDQMETQLTPLKAFILPAGSEQIAHTHIARTVCRRAERYVIELHEIDPVEEKIIRYLNRLSDYLFVLSRTIARKQGVTEVEWNSR